MKVWQALALASTMLTGGVATAAPARCFITAIVSEEFERPAMSRSASRGATIEQGDRERVAQESRSCGEILRLLRWSTVAPRLWETIALPGLEKAGLGSKAAPRQGDQNFKKRSESERTAGVKFAVEKWCKGAAPQQSAQQPSRPTEPTDPMPPPNMDYFVGSWTFEWNVPESPLGPAGKIKGKETYKKTSDGVYESEIEGEGPEVAFKGRATTNYNEKERQVTRSETGLFGVSLVKTGPIGGDLGGYYTIFWETQPIRKNGKTIKLKGKTLMLSPANYRLQVQISVDGGPYANFGNPWFRKTEGKPTS